MSPNLQQIRFLYSDFAPEPFFLRGSNIPLSIKGRGAWPVCACERVCACVLTQRCFLSLRKHATQRCTKYKSVLFIIIQIQNLFSHVMDTYEVTDVRRKSRRRRKRRSRVTGDYFQNSYLSLESYFMSTFSCFHSKVIIITVNVLSGKDDVLQKSLITVTRLKRVLRSNFKLMKLLKATFNCKIMS